MTINEVYEIMLYAINKHIDGDLPPDDFHTAIRAGEREYISYLLGSIQQYQYGRPIPRIQYSNNETIRQKLTPLIPPPTTLAISGNGTSAFPTGFILTDAMFTNANKSIRFVQPDRLDSFLSSVIDPIATNPIYTVTKDGYQFYPTTLGSAKVSYIKQPTPMFWASTPDVNDRPIYNAGASVHPVWNDLDCMEIIYRALKLCGVNLQMAVVMSYANQKEKEG